MAGEHGATIRLIRRAVLPRVGGAFDLVVLLAGVNDVLGLHAILDDPCERAESVAVVGIPPFTSPGGRPHWT